jgi:hypothetical protein
VDSSAFTGLDDQHVTCGSGAGGRRSVIGRARVVYDSRADWARQPARETATGEQGTNIILASGQARCGCEQKECQP